MELRCSSVTVVVFNLITDLIYILVDPRIEVGRRRSFGAAFAATAAPSSGW